MHQGKISYRASFSRSEVQLHYARESVFCKKARLFKANFIYIESHQMQSIFKCFKNIKYFLNFPPYLTDWRYVLALISSASICK